jgi:glycosyltransferase involved in cell wall biosynthesis
MSSVDVIVPCYGYGHFLGQCVQSVLSQSLPNVRVLIIDDASPDDTADVASKLIKADTRVCSIRHVSNKGHIQTYNEGIAWAAADYLVLLSADDYLLPGSLERSVHFLNSHPEVGLAWGNAVEGKQEEAVSSWICPPEPPEGWHWSVFKCYDFAQLSGSRNIIRAPTAIVRTHLQKRVGGYRAELPHAGDMEMWLRLALHAPVAKTDAFQAVYRRHAQNMSRTYTRLLDLRQRRGVLDIFLQAAQDIDCSVDELRSQLFWLLGKDALHAASAACNTGDFESSRDLQRFALEVCPEIRRSGIWKRLACKRLLGPRVSSCLLSLFRGFPMRDAADSCEPS